LSIFFFRSFIFRTISSLFILLIWFFIFTTTPSCRTTTSFFRRTFIFRTISSLSIFLYCFFIFTTTIFCSTRTSYYWFSLRLRWL